MQPILDIKNLKVYYHTSQGPVKAVEDVSFSLEPGETQKVKFELSERELSFWNVDLHAWQVEPAEYIFEIGASANDIRGSASVWLG